MIHSTRWRRGKRFRPRAGVVITSGAASFAAVLGTTMMRRGCPPRTAIISRRPTGTTTTGSVVPRPWARPREPAVAGARRAPPGPSRVAVPPAIRRRHRERGVPWSSCAARARAPPGDGPNSTAGDRAHGPREARAASSAGHPVFSARHRRSVMASVQTSTASAPGAAACACGHVVRVRATLAAGRRPPRCPSGRDHRPRASTRLARACEARYRPRA